MYEAIKMFSDECRRASMVFTGRDNIIDGASCYQREVRKCPQERLWDPALPAWEDNYEGACCERSRLVVEDWYRRDGHVWFVESKKLCNKLLLSTSYMAEIEEVPDYPVQVLFPDPVLGIRQMVGLFDSHHDLRMFWNEGECFCDYDVNLGKMFGVRPINEWATLYLNDKVDVNKLTSHEDMGIALTKLFLGLLLYLQGTQLLIPGVPDSPIIGMDDSIRPSIPGTTNKRSHIIPLNEGLEDEEEIVVVQGPRRTSVISLEHYRRGCWVNLVHPRWHRHQDGSHRTIWRSASWVRGRKTQETMIVK
jgi:hypothetical protein